MTDALLLQRRLPQVSAIFAASQLQGSRDTQEDYFVNFNDECFVVCDGVGGMPHGEIASSLAGDTAVWAYKLVRRRKTYWSHKLLFLSRIFRTTNITLWQKQREEGFEGGMATTMLVCIVINRNFYIGSVGDSSAFLVHEGNMDKLTTEDIDASGRLTKAVGTTRYGLTPSIVTGELSVGDILMLATDGVAAVCNTPAVVTLLDQAGQSASDLSDAAVDILGLCEKHGVTDNMTVCLIKRTA